MIRSSDSRNRRILGLFGISFFVLALDTLRETTAMESASITNVRQRLLRQVCYHLERFNDSLKYALESGDLFDVNGRTEYTQTLVEKFIDEYTRLRLLQEQTSDVVTIDPRLTAVVESLLHSCSESELTLGIAFESRRLDEVEEAIRKSGNFSAMIEFARRVCFETSMPFSFRNSILKLLVKLHNEFEIPDYLGVCQCLIFLDDPSCVVEILDKLIHGSEDDTLLAYQVAFDLCDNATQQFVQRVSDLLRDVSKKVASEAAPSEDRSTKMDVDSGTEVTEEHSIYDARLESLLRIMSCEVSVQLYLEFLYRTNHSDLALLEAMKTQVESRSSVLHSAIVYTNVLMHAGTTVDTFLRTNLEWLRSATNWAKFAATAGLGVIHKGHHKEALQLLSPYLPNPTQPGAGSSYSEGGALYALGLIHANHGSGILETILEAMHGAGAANEIVQHGAALGLGLAAMGTCNQVIYEELKQIMYVDSAVAGEAAGLAMGMVMLGSCYDVAVSEMLAYAHETQHERIIRGLALGLALVMFGHQERAETLIEQLCRDKDHLIRYGGMYTIGLAYCGTADHNAIQRLLHAAVSDVSDDVRRAAVTSLGFLLLRNPDQCTKMVSLLSESYNPHLRYGATLALGIACANTALPGAVDLLEPMTRDPVDFVRQGAQIALAFVLLQTSSSLEPRVERITDKFFETISDKHEETMTKVGAILANGIINAGGRNVTISLHSSAGHTNVPGIVGIAIFCQYWYWFPYIHFLSLAFTPTAIIGLNSNLEMPSEFTFRSNCNPSKFAYPPEMKKKQTDATSKVTTSVLSYSKKTAGKTASVKVTGKESDSNTRSTKESNKEESVESGASAVVDTSAPEHLKNVDKNVEESKEPDHEILSNPSRVTMKQLQYITFDQTQRYVTVKSKGVYGIVMLRDTAPKAVETTTDDEAMETTTDDKALETTTDDKAMETTTDDKALETTTDDKAMETTTDDKALETTTDDKPL